jgi:hypothetical protein
MIDPKCPGISRRSLLKMLSKERLPIQLDSKQVSLFTSRHKSSTSESVSYKH